MVTREEMIKSLGPDERRWIARCQLIGILLFLALLTGVVLWSFAYDFPAVLETAASVPAMPANAANSQPDDNGEAR